MNWARLGSFNPYLILIYSLIISPISIKSSFNQRPWQYENHIQYHPPHSEIIRSGGFTPDPHWYSISNKQEVSNVEPQTEEPTKRTRIPGLPRDPPLPTLNITNVITLIELAGNDMEIDDETEALLVETLKEVLTFIGAQDTGDLMGMFLMYFITGPMLIPLFWMPIAIMALGFLVIPIIYNGTLAAGVGRNVYILNHSLESSQCLDMISCELNNLLKTSRWSSWLSRTFKLTKVEWASVSSKKKGRRSGMKAGHFDQEECSKYACTLVQPVQRFLGSWYNYIFTYQKTFDNIV